MGASRNASERKGSLNQARRKNRVFMGGKEGRGYTVVLLGKSSMGFGVQKTFFFNLASATF